MLTSPNRTVAAGRKQAQRIRKTGPCRFCGDTDGVQRHHVNGNPTDNSRHNLMDLCRPCHDKAHAATREGPRTHLHRRTRQTTDAEPRQDMAVVEHFSLKPFSMSPEEIKGAIDPEEMDKVRTKDPKPEFRAYAIAHDGHVEGKLVDGGKVKVNYLKHAIRKLYSAMDMGAALFKHHTDTNDHEGRTTIGHVVGKILQEVKGRLYDIAIAYINPDYRQEKLDVASIEATVRYSRNGDEIQVDEVEQVTGIALADSDESTPGFPGATLLGAMQAFKQRGETRMPLTIEEIQEAIEKQKIDPSVLFSDEALLDDPTVKDHVAQTSRNNKGHSSRIEKSLAKEREERATENEAHEAKVGELTQANLQLRASPMILKSVDGMTISDKAKAYVKTTVERFNTASKDDDGLKKDIDVFIASGLGEFRKISADVFGEKVPEDQGTKPPENQTGPGAPTGDGQGGSEADSGRDPTTPEGNSFIPQAAKAAGA